MLQWRSSLRCSQSFRATIPPPHEHEYVVKHDGYNETSHWKECVCGDGYLEVHSLGTLVFDDPEVIRSCSCGYIEVVGEPLPVSSEAEFLSAIKLGFDIVLKTDVVVTSGNGSDDFFHFKRDTVVYLNGHELSFDISVQLNMADVPYRVSFVNGKIRSSNEELTFGFMTMDKSWLYMEDVEYSSSTYYGIVMRNSTVEVVGSNILSQGSFGIATFSNGDYADIFVADSKVSTEGGRSGDNTAILFETQSGHVEVYDSTIIGDRQAVVIKCGENHEIQNSILKATGAIDKTSFNWGSGNSVPFAALVVGNGYASTPYKSKTSVLLHNATLDAPDDDRYYAMYVYQLDSEYNVFVGGTLDYVGKNTKVNFKELNGATLSLDKLFARTQEEFTDLLSCAGFSVIWLANDIEVTESFSEKLGFSRTTINLNGYTLSYSYFLTVWKNNTVNFFNGTLKFSGTENYGINVQSGASLCFDNVKFNSNGYGIRVFYDGNLNSTVKILNGSEINAKKYGIQVITSGSDEGNELSGVRVYISDSTVSTMGSNSGDNSAILFNTRGFVNIEDSTIIADRQAVILRGGEGHVIRTSKLEVTGDCSVDEGYLDKEWGNENNVPLAALVVGNRTGSFYKYPASVTLENARISAPVENNAESPIQYHAIYVWQYDENSKVSVDGTVRFEDTNDKANDNVNGATYEVVEERL